ncbi:hypothetical protein BG000_005617, partial [Podila horticola]
YLPPDESDDSKSGNDDGDSGNDESSDDANLGSNEGGAGGTGTESEDGEDAMHARLFPSERFLSQVKARQLTGQGSSDHQKNAVGEATLHHLQRSFGNTRRFRSWIL